MAGAIMHVRLLSTHRSHMLKRKGLNKMLQDEKCKLLVKSTKETEKTWTIKFPFLKGDLQISQIYELYPPPVTEASVETKMEVSNPNEARVADETSRQLETGSSDVQHSSPTYCWCRTCQLGSTTDVLDGAHPCELCSYSGAGAGNYR